MTVIKLSRFQPPTTFGPVIEIIVEQITAIEPKYVGVEEYSVIHLVGGEQILVCQDVSTVWNLISDRPSRVIHG